MTQAEFIQAVQMEMGLRDKKELPLSNIKAVLDAAGAVSRQELAGGREANLFGLGAIKVVQRAARQGRNPRTGEALEIPARKGLKFRASRALKDALKG
jgi:DNA-binding protein HU-beta